MVYVDMMKAKYGRMIMCHMVADTEEELLNMAKKIGVDHKWHQEPNTHRSHFDICMKKRDLAIKNGASEISRRDLAKILKKKKESFHVKNKS